MPVALAGTPRLDYGAAAVLMPLADAPAGLGPQSASTACGPLRRTMRT